MVEYRALHIGCGKLFGFANNVGKACIDLLVTQLVFKTTKIFSKLLDALFREGDLVKTKCVVAPLLVIHRSSEAVA